MQLPWTVLIVRVLDEWRALIQTHESEGAFREF